MKKNLLLSLLAVTVMTGCGSHQSTVSPLRADLAVQHVCIERNPAVTIGDFLPAVEDGFARHGISYRLYLGDMPEKCDSTVKYTALRSWDLKTFLREARIDMFKDDKKVAGIEYYHPQNLNLSKFGSSKEKIAPLMDEMLVEYPVAQK